MKKAPTGQYKLWPWVGAVAFEILATFFGLVARRHLSCSGPTNQASFFVHNAHDISIVFGIIGVILALVGYSKARKLKKSLRVVLCLLIVAFIVWAFFAQFEISLCGIGA